MRSPNIILIIFILFLSVSCRQAVKEKDSFKPVFSTYKSDTSKNHLPLQKNEIFYGILTPVEMCAIFNRLGITYNNATLNPISNRDLYLSSLKSIHKHRGIWS